MKRIKLLIAQFTLVALQSLPDEVVVHLLVAAVDGHDGDDRVATIRVQIRGSKEAYPLLEHDVPACEAHEEAGD